MTFSGGQWNRERALPAQFTTRVAILGGLALVAFSVIFFRLWYLQVLSSDKYKAEAQGQRVREVTVQAPRGEIVDRDGNVLVSNRTALALQVRPDELPATHDRRIAVLERVADAAAMPLDEVQKQIREQTAELPSNPVTLRRDVPHELVFFLRENQERFPGVSVDQVYVRRYPGGTFGAHLFGYVREVSAEQLSEPRYDDLAPGDEIGQDGIELAYDSTLRGVKGISKIPVDASGSPTGRGTTVREPEPGNDLVLTIDSGLQSAGESALQSFGLPGAFVAMDANTGEVLALGSNPTFDPSVFAKPVVPESEFNALNSEANGAPLLNRAIQGLYPTGSTFKPITALAALDSGEFTTTETIVDGGSFKVGDLTLHNAGDASYGPLQLAGALQVSSDIFFYTLGARLDGDIEQSGKEWIQDWSKSLGLGEPTGIDLPGEESGLVPTPEWRNDLYKQGGDRPWSIGDNVNLSVGQGDLQANPLQMAVAYAAIGNGGQVLSPHLALRAEDPAGRVVQEIEPAPQRQISIDTEWRSAIMNGLTKAAMEPGGTSFVHFGGFPVEVAGKTGTAETFHEGVPYDQSWYVALAPADDPRIVVALTIERGGFGADAAAPAVKSMLTEFFRIGAEDLELAPDTGAAGATVGYD